MDLETKKDFINSWAKSSTIHGIQKISTSTSKLIKYTYACVLAISVGLLIYMSGYHISKYLLFEVITKEFRHSEKNLVFPSVTICNLNGFTSNYSEDKIKFYLKKITNRTNVNLTMTDIGYLKSIFKINARIFSDFEKKQLGFTLEEMIISCSFSGEKCNMSEFSWLYSMNYGNCFQFNSGFDAFGN